MVERRRRQEVVMGVAMDDKGVRGRRGNGHWRRWNVVLGIGIDIFVRVVGLFIFSYGLVSLRNDERKEIRVYPSNITFLCQGAVIY